MPPTIKTTQHTLCHTPLTQTHNFEMFFVAPCLTVLTSPASKFEFQPKKSSLASGSSAGGTLLPRPGLRRMRSASPGSMNGPPGGGPWADMRMHPNPAAASGLVIPRARVSHHRGPASHFSDDDFMSPVEVTTKTTMSRLCTWFRHF